MPDHSYLYEGSPTAETSTSRQASHISKEEFAARSQRWKEGSPAEWQAMLSDLAQEGELTSTEDDEQAISDEDRDEDLWDSEIESGDEDALAAEDRGEIEEVFRLEFDGDGDAGRDPFESTGAYYRILVQEGRCRLEIPAWFSGTTPEGNAEPFQRLETYQRIVRWLNEDRTAFLKDPDPWHLGAGALKELSEGKPSVTEDGLKDLLKLKAEINRHKRHCDLVWEDGTTLPLDFLFRNEAKHAWVANALVQRYRGDDLSGDDLDLLCGLTTPKQGERKNEVMAGGLDGLDFRTFVQRACLMVGSTWSELPDSLRERILKDHAAE